MFVVVTYDVNTETPEGRRRLRNVAKTCMRFGQRVQNSVFECSIAPSDYLMLVSNLLEIIDEEMDNLRIYKLGKNYASKIESYGHDRHVPFDDVMMI
ncbi:CRISPR-associated endonuclease Cas2 [Bifidobacterium animalis]|uniref:CRISPR-associated endonuclease Cas2 n=1 Tax=Bifidobacterium animalis TaxID=28025 RepID=UPI00069C9122|nr:CRISPR-associated endonuclease Cas2 [Bifidobacterium animalis]RYN12210.1 CRISPR-associated protein Cas2 [Bifidobacterium animalis subsp. animalis]